jgi:hypothetical protein
MFMSSWSLAGDWLALVGLVFLALGSAAQAAGNFAESKDIFQRLKDKENRDKLVKKFKPLLPGVMIDGLSSAFSLPSPLSGVVALLSPLFQVLFVVPFNLTNVRDEYGEDAERVLKLINLGLVWSLILLGSLLALVAAVIQLVLAYH